MDYTVFGDQGGWRRRAGGHYEQKFINNNNWHASNRDLVTAGERYREE